MPPLRSLPALSLGPEAAALRQVATQGHVLAVLRNALYLEADEGYVINIVGPDAPDGPLTLRVPDLSALLHPLRDQQGAPFQATPAALEIAGTVRVTWAQAAAWTPILPAHIAPADARTAAAHTLAAELAYHNFGFWILDFGDELSSNPKSQIPNPKSLDPIQRRLLTHLTTLHTAWLGGEPAAVAEAAVRLLGLGPGLTPSGDDILMGLLAALHWQARLGALPPEPITTLIAAVQAAAPHQTTRLSTRLLAHAADGCLYAPAMALGTALLAGDPAAIPAPARQLFTIGHTSGADLAIGLLIGTLLAC